MDGEPLLPLMSSVALAILNVVVAAVVSAHVILNKRDVRAAIGWAGLVWLTPFVGAFLYVAFGINRIQRRAARLRREGGAGPVRGADRRPSEREPSLRRYVEHVTGFPMTRGNRVEPLVDGDAAYPSMLAAIDAAERTIGLASYIFDHDSIGLRFADALEAAVRRGVEVRVLIDGVGARYSRRPRMPRTLRERGVPVALFLSKPIPRNPYVNLRNHRKILVVDGRVGFTGGMNIRQRLVLGENPAHPVRDVHFRLEGPVVGQLATVFAEDWVFTTGERLESERWIREGAGGGMVDARGIPDGPDEDFESLRWTLLGALAEARRRVRVVTPYFIPDQGLITALNVAAMRGVDVDILIPERGNLRFVQWACMGQLWQVIERGCRVWLAPQPFDHSKLVLVDDDWALVGSGNWDARSLRLNFEFNVECYDMRLCERLDGIVDEKLARARRLELSEVDERKLPVRLRDGVARLFAPYL